MSQPNSIVAMVDVDPHFTRLWGGPASVAWHDIVEAAAWYSHWFEDGEYWEIPTRDLGKVLLRLVRSGYTVEAMHATEELVKQ